MGSSGKFYDGYMTKGGLKKAFEVGAASKKDAYNQMKAAYPGWRITVVGYHRGKRVRA